VDGDLDPRVAVGIEMLLDSEAIQGWRICAKPCHNSDGKSRPPLAIPIPYARLLKAFRHAESPHNESK